MMKVVAGIIILSFLEFIQSRLTFVFRRNCISTEPCDYLRPGCASDADCKTGLTCGLVGIVPTCLDLDECAQDPDICGSDTCINLISTYRYVKVIMGYN